jgi:hypothetical protein
MGQTDFSSRIFRAQTCLYSHREANEDRSKFYFFNAIIYPIWNMSYKMSQKCYDFSGN